LFFTGFLVILYISLGFVYWQQGAKQREFNEQITKLGAVVSRPLPSDAELRARFNEVNHNLAALKDSEAIRILVDIAERSGIDVSEDSGKFRITPARVRSVQMAGGTYRVMSFSSISVQGDPESVLAFIGNLDSGKTLSNMVLTKLSTQPAEVRVSGDEDRISEFQKVISAVIAMIADNGLVQIPNPRSYENGVATSLMGDSPDTTLVIEGFPDVSTTIAEKGYTGAGSPRDGYVLYQHDKTSSDNTSQFNTVNYISILITDYYYTCEADGTVRQFERADVTVAIEHFLSPEFTTETRVLLDVEIYMK